MAPLWQYQAFTQCPGPNPRHAGPDTDQESSIAENFNVSWNGGQKPSHPWCCPSPARPCPALAFSRKPRSLRVAFPMPGLWYFGITGPSSINPPSCPASSLYHPSVRSHKGSHLTPCGPEWRKSWLFILMKPRLVWTSNLRASELGRIEQG